MKRLREFLPAVLATEVESPERNQDWVLAFWEETVGEAVAARARPKLLQGRLLLVEVDGLDWVAQLEAIGPRLVRELNRAAGRPLVDRIGFRPVKDSKAAPARMGPALARSSRPEGETALDPMRRRLYETAQRQAR